MKPVDFFDNVNSDEEMKIVDVVCGENKEDDYATVLHTPTKQAWKIQISTILSSEWGVLKNILSGKRDPTVLEHMTRIVGYYALVKNFNKSKIGELKGRIAGDYSVDGKPRESVVATAVVDDYSKNGDQ